MRSTVLFSCFTLACTFVIRDLDDVSDLESLHIFCTKEFGNNYGRRNPPDDFVIKEMVPFKHDAILQSIEGSTRKLIGSDRIANQQMLFGLLGKVAKDPSNGEKLFRFAYACTLASSASSKSGGAFWMEGQHRYWNDILKWMLAKPSDVPMHQRSAQLSYEWLRVRYLVEGSSLTDHPGIIPVGKHLLPGHGDDLELSKVLSLQLGSIRGDVETREALKLCEFGISKWPSYPVFYAAESYIYQTRWLGLGRRGEDLKRAIAAAESALQRVKPHEYLEGSLEHSIAAMKKTLAGK